MGFLFGMLLAEVLPDIIETGVELVHGIVDAVSD